MDFLIWARSPWGEDILTHMSWDLLWASLFGGLAFLVAHAGYIVLSAHRKRHETETDALEAAHPELPARITRHSRAARMFHWVMAAAMFVLLLTAFLPVAGIRFPWVTWHWAAGVVLDRVDPLSCRARHALAGLLVDLGRTEGFPGAES